jgi:glycosyltransferase involved in cell wall biosynthesis
LRSYKFPLSWIDRWMLKQARWAIAGNHEAEQVLRRRGYAGDVAVIPQYGVDPKLFAPQAESPAHAVWTIGFLGRLLEEKGLHTLLQAVATLNFPFELVLTGQGPMAEALKMQVARLGLDARVRFVPSVPNAEVPKALRDLDVLVLPSETRKDWKEQFGRVLVEAMACGVPVVGSDSGEIPHVIGQAGLVFPEGQPAPLAECLTRLHTDAALYARCVVQGRTRALAEFTNEGIARKTFAFYQSIMGERR